MQWRDAIAAALTEMERHFDRLVPAETAGRATVIAPYRGFGRGHELIIRGRVLAEKLITRAATDEPVWRNLVNAYRRFQSDEVRGAKVTAAYRDAVVETVSNIEGHFQVVLKPSMVDEELLWHEVTLKLDDGSTSAIGHVIVPPAHAEFGVISDIDDTVIVTGATSLSQMIRGILMENAATRVAFEGIADLYKALHRDRNPIFYVSSSPWNLYDLLADFMSINGIPHGPMFLQDWGIEESTLLHAPHDLHKTREIQSILDYYPSLPFVLIGDSGQRDPEIYLQVIRANPGRVRVAYIRDVTPEVRDRAVTLVAEQAAAAGTEMIYVPDSAAALAHAARLGLTSGS